MQQIVLAYAIDLEQTGPDEIIVTCKNLPEVLTSGTNVDEALSEAAEAITAALEARVQLGETIGPVTAPTPDQYLVAVDPKVAARALLINEMCRLGLNKSGLARAMELDEKAVRRFLTPGATTKMQTYLEALGKLGVSAQTAMIFGRLNDIQEAV